MKNLLKIFKKKFAYIKIKCIFVRSIRHNIKKNAMKTLILKKEVKGYYSNQIDNIRISVSECFGSWTGAIENLDANCEKFAVYTCYGKTKKEVTNQLINFIINF